LIILIVKLLVGGHDPIVRKGFHEIVRARPEWVVAGEAATMEELTACLRSERFDVAILDVPFGETSGLDAVARIRGEFPALPLVVISTYPESHYALAFMRAGVNAFLPRNMEPDEILNALAAVAEGGRYVSAGLAGELARGLGRHGAERPHERLSAREFEVFRLLSLGKSPTEIAGMLHLSVKTVSTYRSRILDKTGFRSNADMVGYAIRNKLI
jgi:two-component system, NarL family, invasion response regulator UvrY